ncbi:MAG: hypothetical protein QOF76_4257 [Solirubrobacteraceae bacterium]|nr:hypothetical protein [Solirubrobacteraceae bacterium]
MPAQLEPARRRELVRLVVESGLTPAQAAERLRIPESHVRSTMARWYSLTTGAEEACQARFIHVPRRRRVLAGLGLTLAFIPIGMLAGAALIGDDGGLPSLSHHRGATAHLVFRPAEARQLLDLKNASSIAYVKADHVKVYRWADPHAHRYELQARTLSGGARLPIVFSVISRKDGWLYVELPTRPNLSHAWIHASVARVRRTPYLLDVALRRKLITVFKNGTRVSQWKIGVGQSVTPTPTGRYFLTDLVKPPQPGGLYGAYAFGLSAHSNVLTSFGTGDGQIGLHGTNDPASLGTRVSHGCLRMTNRHITWLAHNVPVGSPIVIRRGQPPVVTPRTL